MTAILLALASALAFGVSDFLAGLVSRRASYAHVGLASQVCATVAGVAALAALMPGIPSATGLAWGAASGAGGALGTLCLYRGLGRGHMTVVAPLSAVGGAALPAAFALAVGARPGPSTLLGIALALPGLWLITRTGNSTRGTDGVGDGLLAGVGFALLYVALERAGDGSGLWPVVAGQAVSLAVQAAFVLSREDTRRRPRGRLLPGALWVGILGVGATVLYFLAARRGALEVVAVLSALYPAATVLLAAIVLREKVSRRQRVGLALAAVAVATLASR